MDEKYTETAVVKGPSWVLSITALMAPDREKLLSPKSKVALSILDYSAGTGGAAVRAGFRLEMRSFYTLLAIARDASFAGGFTLPEEECRKLYVSNEPDGDGLVPAFHLALTRRQAEDGEPSGKPWRVLIDEGRAEKVKEGRLWREDEGSFRSAARCEARLSDSEMREALETVAGYVENYRRIVADLVLTDGIRGRLGENGADGPEGRQPAQPRRQASARADVQPEQLRRGSFMDETAAAAPAGAGERDIAGAGKAEDARRAGHGPEGRVTAGSAEREQKGGRKTAGTLDVTVTSSLWPVDGGKEYLARLRCVRDGREYGFKVSGDVYARHEKALTESLENGRTIRVAATRTPDGIIVSDVSDAADAGEPVSN